MFTAYLLNAVSLWPDEVCTMVLHIKHKKKKYVDKGPQVSLELHSC